MSEKLKESLSAVIDGEADEFELRRVLDEIGKDPELAAIWERYHLIGAVMRRERIIRSYDMGELIWAEVGLDGAEEPALVSVPEPEGTAVRPGSRRARFTSLAVAAMVVLLVGVGYVGVGDPDGTPVPEVAEVTPAALIQEPAANEAVMALTSEVTPVDQARTEAYVLRHLQQLGMNRSGIGFAKMVAYERE